MNPDYSTFSSPQSQSITQDQLRKLNLEQLEKDIEHYESMAAYFQRMADYSQTLLELAREDRR